MNTATSIHEESLLDRARNGSTSALGSLADYYRPILLKLANAAVDSHMRPRLAPSDVVQSALVAATSHFDEFQGTSEDAFRQWLLRIFNNHLVDNIRRLHTQKRAIGREVRGVHELTARNDDSPSELMLAREEVSRLIVCIDRLHKRSREIIRMRYIEGLTFETIGNKLNLKYDATRRRWLGAVNELHRLMKAGESAHD